MFRIKGFWHKKPFYKALMRKIPYFYIKLLPLAPYNACLIGAVAALSRRNGSSLDSLLMGACPCTCLKLSW
jgi:hypothetical protein